MACVPCTREGQPWRCYLSLLHAEIWTSRAGLKHWLPLRPAAVPFPTDGWGTGPSIQCFVWVWALGRCPGRAFPNDPGWSRSGLCVSGLERWQGSSCSSQPRWLWECGVTWALWVITKIPVFVFMWKQTWVVLFCFFKWANLRFQSWLNF